MKHLFFRILRGMRIHIAQQAEVVQASLAFRCKVITVQRAPFNPLLQFLVERGLAVSELVRPNKLNWSDFQSNLSAQINTNLVSKFDLPNLVNFLNTLLPFLRELLSPRDFLSIFYKIWRGFLVEITTV